MEKTNTGFFLLIQELNEAQRVGVILGALAGEVKKEICVLSAGD